MQIVRHPEGQIANPQAGDPGQPAEISHPGTLVSMRVVPNLKLAYYFLRHRMRTSRRTTTPDVTLDAVRALRDLQNTERSHVDPMTTPQVTGNDWPKIMESIQEYIGGHQGVKDAPLDYVTRELTVVAAEATYLPNGTTGLDYVTDEEEMTARSPHTRMVGDHVQFHPDYVTDCKKVWDLVAGLTRDKPAWAIVKPFQAKKDGSFFFLGLWSHYLGENNINNLATAAETTLENTTYKGESKRWTFDQYVRLYMDQHQIFTSLTSHGYTGIHERSKVRHLMAGIKTDKFDSVKTQILSTAALRSNFTGYVTLYKDFISQARNTGGANSLNISAFNSNGDQPPKGGGRGGERETGMKWKNVILMNLL